MTWRTSDELLDVAIVGGGVAGTYCAWRLGADAPQAAGEGKLKIGLFEGSSHIGGRLVSVAAPNAPGIVCELGGQHFFKSHVLVRSLATRLGLTQVELHPGSGVGDLAYLRTRRMLLKDLQAQTKLADFPYLIDQAERGIFPIDLIPRALDAQVPGLATVKPQDLDRFLREATVDGRHLENWGSWNLFERSLSHEACLLLRDCMGFDTLLWNWNALEMIRFFMAAGADNFDPPIHALPQGYQQIPLTLCDAFEASGGRVHTQHRLRAFDCTELSDGTPVVRLTVSAGSQGWQDDDDGRPTVVYARSLILALPRRSIELLDRSGAVLGPEDRERETRVWQLLSAVTPAPFFKLFLCYPKPWWRQAGISVEGPTNMSLTDLPIRQCYYWAAEDKPDDQNAVMMAAFDDSLNYDYWTGLRGQRGRPLPGPGRQADWNEYALNVDHVLVADVQRQLSLMHGVPLAELPPPYAGAFADWGEDPFGGAIHFWNIHAPSSQWADDVLQPVPGLPVYICGEAYSRTQGWVEGALETAENVLERHFKLPPPTWLTPA